MAKEFYAYEDYNTGIVEKPTRKAFVDLQGLKVNKLTVLDWAGINNGRNQWWCQCECDSDRYFKVASTTLQNGVTKSCGCNYKNNGGNVSQSLEDFQLTVDNWKILTYEGHNYPCKAECVDCGSQIDFTRAISALRTICNSCTNTIKEKRDEVFSSLGQTEVEDFGDCTYSVQCNNCKLIRHPLPFTSIVECYCHDHKETEAYGVYVLTSPTKDYIKIGKSVNPYERCRAINSTGGENFQVAHIEYVRGQKNAFTIETWVHKELGGKDKDSRPGFTGDTEIFYVSLDSAIDTFESIRQTLNVMQEGMDEPRVSKLPEVPEYSLEFASNDLGVSMWYKSRLVVCEYFDIPHSWLKENLDSNLTDCQHYGKYVFSKETFYTFHGYRNEIEMDADLINNYGTSVERVKTAMQKHGKSFADARSQGVKRTNRHVINGENKTNKAWFEYFGVNPINAKNHLCKSKDMRKTLEHYGIDTSQMIIEKHI